MNRIITLTFILLIFMMSTSRADDGEAVYQKICQFCHEDGILGSPMIGDVEEWERRRLKGIEHLYQSAIDGTGHMPERLHRRGFDETSIKHAVDYLLKNSEPKN